MPQAYIGGILDAATIFLIELKHLENGQIHLGISEWNCLPSALKHLYVSRITL